MNSPILIVRMSFAWPDGILALDDVSAVFNTGRTGLIGVNGCGKSTLLRLIAGQLTPSDGYISVAEVAYLPQSVVSGPDDTVADLLGVRAQLDAWTAIAAGSGDPADFEALGDAWDIEERVDAMIEAVRLAGGVSGIDAARPVATLSGGEAMALAVAGARLRQAPVTLLDEPTNNLDEAMRALVYEMIGGWPGTLVVVSHDVCLLDLMDETAELHDGHLSVFGGNYSQWRQALDGAQAAAEQAVRAARASLRVAKRQRVATLERTDRSLAQSKKKAIGEGLGKAARDQFRNRAENKAGRAKDVAADRVAEAQGRLDDAAGRVRRDERVNIDLPDPGVVVGRTILTISWGNQAHIVQGPERLALTGRNGVGKTSLIEAMLGLRPALPGAPVARLATNRVGYLPQCLNTLDEQSSVLDNVLAVAPSTSTTVVRAQLARLLIRGDAVFRPVADLSGGERFRVALARLLLADPPAQVLIFDEPTNNLDLASVDQLVDALANYRGAVLVVSHDAWFRARLGVTVTLKLTGADVIRRISSGDGPELLAKSIKR